MRFQRVWNAVPRRWAVWVYRGHLSTNDRDARQASALSDLRQVHSGLLTLDEWRWRWDTQGVLGRPPKRGAPASGCTKNARARGWRG